MWKLLHSVDYMCAAVSRNGPVSIYMDWLNNVSKVSAFDADLGHIKFEARQICAEKKFTCRYVYVPYRKYKDYVYGRC